MKSHELIEAAFMGAARHYEIPWQLIVRQSMANKQVKKPALARMMVAYALSLRFEREEIADMLGVAVGTVKYYCNRGYDKYHCYGSWYDTVHRIRQHFLTK